MQVALATYRPEPTLFHDEAPLIAEFQRRGIVATPVIWDDGRVDWSQFDLVLPRNTWDYHSKPQEFRAWLSALVDDNITVINMLDVIFWNMHKSYLRDLQAHVPIIPTEFVSSTAVVSGGTQSLQAILQARGWSQAVIKPMIGASGDDSFRTSIDDAALHQAQFDVLVTQSGALVQPFMPQIADGEWSLVFFNGAYSHCVLKTPAEGEMYVHEERGGTNRAAQPAPAHIAQAQQSVDVVRQQTGVVPVYVRVDGILVDGVFTLMELECIEPELYFSYVGQAAPRFVDAVLGAL